MTEEDPDTEFSPEAFAMLGGPDPIVVEPREAGSITDPNKRGIITIRELTDKMYERTVTFPDGSGESMFFGDWRHLMADPPENGNCAEIAADAAAGRMAAALAGQLLYCHEAKAWFVWDGAVWRRDRGGAATRMMREALRDTEDDETAAPPATRLVADAEKLARTETALSATSHGCDTGVPWDADPLHLGTPGGTIDLTTGVLHPADPADRITRATAVTPAEHADCPIWRRFLDEAMGGDQTLVAFLQRFLGYALTGETCEHTLLFGLGEGGNGKSVFVNTMRGIFGDYAAVAVPDLLAQGTERRAGKAHSTEIAMLDGARLATASETEEGRVWADGRLKLLTGGDPVTARFLGRDHFTFTPRFKLIVVGNHMPVLRTVDAAIRRRLCVVPFVTQPATPDRQLEARLRAEWPAILRWMIEGCLAWRADGLGRPDAVTAATDAYLGGQDIVGQFLGEACDRRPNGLETAASLYAAWCAYAKAIGETPGTQRRFAARLARHGLTRERMRHTRFYRGVRLLRSGELQEEMREIYGRPKVVV